MSYNFFFFFFNDTATTEIYTLSLHDALPISSAQGEVAGVERRVFWQVVDHCYLCDMCFMTKCPYVPPHPWNVDFRSEEHTSELQSRRDLVCRLLLEKKKKKKIKTKNKKQVKY